MVEQLFTFGVWSGDRWRSGDPLLGGYFRGACFACRRVFPHSSAVALLKSERALLHDDVIFDEAIPTTGPGFADGRPSEEAPSLPDGEDEGIQSYRGASSAARRSQSGRPDEPSSTASNGHHRPAAATTIHRETKPITFLSLASVKIVAAACGATHLLLLSDSGAVYVFGVGDVGQLGLGEERLFVKQPKRVESLADICIKQIAAGRAHSVALSEKGVVYTWGEADAVGDGYGQNRWAPEPVLRTKVYQAKVSLIAAAFSQSMVITELGELFIWGESFAGQFYTTPHRHQTFPSEDPIIQISIGRHFALALSSQGKLYAWGDGTYCELGRLSRTPTRGATASIMTPTEMVLADTLGTLLPKIVSMATGARHVLLLSETGRVFSFGENICGQCGVPLHADRFDTPKLVKIQAGDTKPCVRLVAAGPRHSAAITTNNQLFLWGHSGHHKLIFTAPPVTLLEERFGVDVGHMGVSVRSGLKECAPKPRLVFSLLHHKVSLVCLGDEFTVVVTGEGRVLHPRRANEIGQPVPSLNCASPAFPNDLNSAHHLKEGAPFEYETPSAPFEQHTGTGELRDPEGSTTDSPRLASTVACP